MRLSILVVEPDDLTLQTTRSMIEASGHIVFTAKNRGAALNMLSAIGVDVVVTSLALEEKDEGLLLASQAKTLQSSIVIFLISDKYENLLPYHSKVDVCIQNPIDCDEIEHAVKFLRKKFR